MADMNLSKHGHCHEYVVMGLSKCFRNIIIKFYLDMKNEQKHFFKDINWGQNGVISQIFTL